MKIYEGVSHKGTAKACRGRKFANNGRDPPTRWLINPGAEPVNVVLQALLLVQDFPVPKDLHDA